MRKFLFLLLLLSFFVSPFSFADNTSLTGIDITRNSTQNTLVDSAVNEYIDQVVSDYQNTVKQDNSGADTSNYDLTVDTNIIENGKKFISVSVDTYQYTGWAHGNSFTKTFVYSLENKRFVTAENTKLLEKLSTKAFPYFVKVLTSLGDTPDTDWVKEGLAPTPENWQDFTIQTDKDGKLTVTFYFEQYQIAAYAFWPQSITFDAKGNVVE